jgi:hypothetical protein
MDGLYSWSRRFAKKKNLSSPPGIKYRFVGRAASILATIIYTEGLYFTPGLLSAPLESKSRSEDWVKLKRHGDVQFCYKVFYPVLNIRVLLAFDWK